MKNTISCPDCGGSGTRKVYGVQTCSSCGGNIPQPWENPCWTCNNYGTVNVTIVENCTRCGGARFIFVNE